MRARYMLGYKGRAGELYTIPHAYIGVCIHIHVLASIKNVVFCSIGVESKDKTTSYKVCLIS